MFFLHERNRLPGRSTGKKQLLLGVAVDAAVKMFACYITVPEFKL